MTSSREAAKIAAVRTSYLFDYIVICRRDTNGSFVANVPALEGCQALGRTPKEAQHELYSVFDLFVDEFEKAKQPMPDDVRLAIIRTNPN